VAKSRVLELDIELNQVQPSDVMNSFPMSSSSHKNNLIKSEIHSNSSNIISNSTKSSVSSKSNVGTKLYKKKTIDSLGLNGGDGEGNESKSSKASKKLSEKSKKNEIVAPVPTNVSNSSVNKNSNISVPAEVIIK
jgi:hypothetical protein